MDGERAVRDLLDWHDLWERVLPARFPHAVNKQDAKQYYSYTDLSMVLYRMIVFTSFQPCRTPAARKGNVESVWARRSAEDARQGRAVQVY